MSVQTDYQAVVDKYAGVITASIVVEEAAKNIGSDLHDYFQWDNNIAGHEHRLSQARRLIRTYEIVHEDVATRMVHVSITNEEEDPSREGQYMPITMVAKSQSLFRRALAESLRHVLALIRSVDDLLMAASAEGFDNNAKLVRAIKNLRKGLKEAEQVFRDLH